MSRLPYRLTLVATATVATVGLAAGGAAAYAAGSPASTKASASSKLPKGATLAQIQAAAATVVNAGVGSLTTAIAEVQTRSDLGGDRAVLLPLKAAKALRRMLRKAQGIAAVVISDSTICATTGPYRGEWAAKSCEDFPDLNPMLHKFLAAGPCELGDRYGINPGKLGRFTKVPDPWGLNTVQVRIVSGTSKGESAPSPVVLVTCGDWFLGVLMPVRKTANESIGQSAGPDWSAVTAPAEKSGDAA